MDRMESILKDRGYTMVGKKGGKHLVQLKGNKVFLVEQIKKHEHLEECLKRSDHVHFVETKLFEECGETYLLMEQCSGGTLYDKIQAHKADNEPFSEKEIMVWLVEICMALAHLHTDGIAHRLLISQNIFFTGHGTVRLGETAELHERAGVEKPKDTIGNQPPQVQDGRPYTIYSDVYALGFLLYEMFTLKTCVRVDTDLISSIRRGSQDLLINFSPGFRNLLTEMLQPKPECRPSVSDIPAKAIVFAHMNAQVVAILKDVKVSLKKLNELAESVENVHINTTLGSLTGGVIGATGGIASIAGVVGLALAPLTLGASMMLTGVGVGIAGGAISAGSFIAKFLNQNITFNEIKSIITDLEEKTAIVDTSIPHLSKGHEVFKDINFPTISSILEGNGLIKGIGLMGILDELMELVMYVGVGKAAAQWAKNVRFAGALTGVFAGFFLAVDAATITMDVMEINHIQQAKKTNMSEGDIKLMKSKIMKFAAEVRQTTKALQEWLDSVSRILQ